MEQIGKHEHLKERNHKTANATATHLHFILGLFTIGQRVPEVLPFLEFSVDIQELVKVKLLLLMFTLLLQGEGKWLVVFFLIYLFVFQVTNRPRTKHKQINKSHSLII